MPKTVFKNDTVDPPKALDIQQQPAKINGMLSHQDPKKSSTNGLPPHMTWPKTVYKPDAEVVAEGKAPAPTKVLPPHRAMPKFIYKTDAEVVAQEKASAPTRVLPPHMTLPKIVYKQTEAEETTTQNSKEACETIAKLSPLRSMGTIVNEPATGSVTVKRVPLTAAALAALDLKTQQKSSQATKLNSDSSNSSVWSEFSTSEASSPVPNEVARMFEMLRLQHKTQEPKASTELQAALKDEDGSKAAKVAVSTSNSVAPKASQVVDGRPKIEEPLASITPLAVNLDGYATTRMAFPYPTMKQIKCIKFFNIEIIEVSSPSKFTFQFNCNELQAMSDAMM